MGGGEAGSGVRERGLAARVMPPDQLFGPMLGPNSENVGPGLGQVWPGFGKLVGDFDFLGTSLRRCRPTLGSGFGEIWANSARFCKRWRGVDRTWGDIDLSQAMLTDFCPTSAKRPASATTCGPDVGGAPSTPQVMDFRGRGGL